MQAVPDITFSPYRKLPSSVTSPGGGTVGAHRAQCRQAARSRQLPGAQSRPGAPPPKHSLHLLQKVTASSLPEYR